MRPVPSGKSDMKVFCASSRQRSWQAKVVSAFWPKANPNRAVSYGPVTLKNIRPELSQRCPSLQANKEPHMYTARLPISFRRNSVAESLRSELTPSALIYLARASSAVPARSVRRRR
jgi:hypothetical protein